MKDVAQALEDRMQLEWGTVVLVVGDLVVLTLLVVVGQVDHGILESPLATLETLLPFAIAWLAVGALAGVFATDVRRSPTRALRATTIAWLAAANVGLILRSSSAFDGGAGWPFNLVLTGFGLLFLGSWRIAYTLVRQRI